MASLILGLELGTNVPLPLLPPPPDPPLESSPNPRIPANGLLSPKMNFKLLPNTDPATPITPLLNAAINCLTGPAILLATPASLSKKPPV